MYNGGTSKSYRQPEKIIPCGWLSDRNSHPNWPRNDKDRAETFTLPLKNVFHPNPAKFSFVLPSTCSETIVQASGGDLI